jgi:hypothetical protein
MKNTLQVFSNNNNLLEAFSKKFALWLRLGWGWVCGVVGRVLVFQGLVAGGFGVRPAVGLGLG